MEKALLYPAGKKVTADSDDKEKVVTLVDKESETTNSITDSQTAFDVFWRDSRTKVLMVLGIRLLSSFTSELGSGMRSLNTFRREGYFGITFGAVYLAAIVALCGLLCILCPASASWVSGVELDDEWRLTTSNT